MVDIIAHSAREILNKAQGLEELKILVDKKVLDEIYIEQLHENLLGLAEVNSETTSQDLYAFMAMAEASATFIEESMSQFEIEDLEVNGFLNKAKNWVGKVLLPWLKNMWKAVWARIQKMTTIKEWKVSGKVGTPILGLASATIEVTFG